MKSNWPYLWRDASCFKVRQGSRIACLGMAIAASVA